MPCGLPHYIGPMSPAAPALPHKKLPVGIQSLCPGFCSLGSSSQWCPDVRHRGQVTLADVPSKAFSRPGLNKLTVPARLFLAIYVVS